MAFSTIVSPELAAPHLTDPDWVFVDCRFALADPAAGKARYDESHVPGAVYAHLDADLSSPITPTTGRHPLPDPGLLATKLGAWGAGPDTQVVAYDDAGGAFAARLWWLLRWLGHDSAAVLDGGFPAWVAAGLPTASEAPSPTPRRFLARPDDQVWLTSEALAVAVSEGSVLLLDARSPERFRGEVEPVDPVAGHVPGAMNAPFQENVDAQGSFLPPETLRNRFETLGQQAQGKEMAHMCGSGVTACHNALAMEVAGLPMGRLYAGSWSEWIRDPSRPTVSGP